MDELRDVLHTGTLARAVVAILHIYLIDYIIRGNGRSYACNLGMLPNGLSFKKMPKEMKDETQIVQQREP